MVDFAIQKLQSWIYSQLTWADYVSYGRIYKNKNESGDVIPEFYTSNNEYIEILFNDRHDATSFFVASDNIDIFDKSILEQNVSLIYQAKIDKLYPSTTHRADSELHNEITKLLMSSPYDVELLSIEIGIDNVYKEFETENVKFTDMSDFHVCRFNLKIKFSTNC